MSRTFLRDYYYARYGYPLSAPGQDHADVPTQPNVLRRRLRIAFVALLVCILGVVTEGSRSERFRGLSVQTFGTVSVNVYRRPYFFSRPFTEVVGRPYWQSWRRSRAVYSVTFVDDNGQEHTYQYKTVRFRASRPYTGQEDGDRVRVWYVPGDPTNFSVDEREPRTWSVLFLLGGIVSILVWLWTGWDYLTTRPRRPAARADVPDHVLTDGT